MIPDMTVHLQYTQIFLECAVPGESSQFYPRIVGLLPHRSVNS